MRPVLEEHAPAVDQPIQCGTVVRAEAAPQRQVVRAVDDVDRVELNAADGLGETGEARGGQPPRPRSIELLAFEEQRRGGAHGEDGPTHASVA